MQWKNEFRTEILKKKNKAHVPPEKGHWWSWNEENGVCKTTGPQRELQRLENGKYYQYRNTPINYQGWLWAWAKMGQVREILSREVRHDCLRPWAYGSIASQLTIYFEIIIRSQRVAEITQRCPVCFTQLQPTIAYMEHNSKTRKWTLVQATDLIRSLSYMPFCVHVFWCVQFGHMCGLVW